MTRDEYKALTREVVRVLQKGLTPDNKSTLDKFSEDAEKLNYNGKPLQVDVSSEEGNNLCQKKDGLYAMNTYVTSESSPVGEIIAFMGTVCPDHYVVCDGAEYPLGTYPILERFFTKQFGLVNHFGGDGENTFAVPDLRGEFLRGSGSGNRDSGTGGDVGEHQNATCITGGIGGGPEHGSSMYLFGAGSWTTPRDFDIGINQIAEVSITASSKNNHRIVGGTVRPTNTSVMYCIKCEPTVMGGSDGSTDVPFTKEEKDNIIAFIIAPNDNSTEESEV